MSRSLITLIAFVLCAAPIRAQEEESVVSFPEYHLSFELPFEDPDTMRRMKAPAKGPVKGTWTWRAGDPELRKDFFSDQLKKTPKSKIKEKIHNKRFSNLSAAKFKSFKSRTSVKSNDSIFINKVGIY